MSDHSPDDAETGPEVVELVPADQPGPPIAPRLWNPGAATLWSLLFGPAFGAVLHAINWRALGRPGKAAVNIAWVGAMLAFYAANVGLLLIPESPTVKTAQSILPFALLIGWYLTAGHSQVAFTRGLPGGYRRRSWAGPLAAGVAGVGLLIAGLTGAAAVLYTPNPDALAEEVRGLMAADWREKPDLRDARVERVTLVHKSGKVYTGFVDAAFGGTSERFTVEVVYDRGNVLWTLTPTTGAAEPAPASLSTEQLVDRSAGGVVRVLVGDARGAITSEGTGFVVDSRGWVATNYHVIRYAERAVVATRDGRRLPVAGVVAAEPRADLAILAVEGAAGLAPLPLGPAAPPRAGQPVVAIGHPGGFDFTVTTGVVSAVRPTAELPWAIADALGAPEGQLWVQSSAPIAPGSSGGPLLDSAGRVVGVNTWVVGGGGFGFAAHVSHLRDLLKRAAGAARPLAPEGIDRPARDADRPLADWHPRVQAVLGDYERAMDQLRRDVGAARTEDEARQLVLERDPGPKFAARACDLADGHRRTVAAAQALWLACQLDRSKDGPTVARAAARLAEDHLDDRGLDRLLPGVAAAAHPEAGKLLRAAQQSSPHRHVRAAAAYLLAARLLQTEAGADGGDAERLLAACAGEYANEKFRGDRLGDLAAGLLDRVRFLAVGKPAREVVGKDADGKEFRLSDYRGRVVLLDFYADWCPYCEATYPVGRKLLKGFEGKPFVILGVNADASPEAVKRLGAAGKVTWRSWWDGTNGPIQSMWQVESFPMLYLIDHEGVIRHVFTGAPGEEELTRAVAELIRKATPGGKPSPATAGGGIPR